MVSPPPSARTCTHANDPDMAVYSLWPRGSEEKALRGRARHEKTPKPRSRSHCCSPARLSISARVWGTLLPITAWVRAWAVSIVAPTPSSASSTHVYAASRLDGPVCVSPPSPSVRFGRLFSLDVTSVRGRCLLSGKEPFFNEGLPAGSGVVLHGRARPLRGRAHGMIQAENEMEGASFAK